MSNRWAFTLFYGVHLIATGLWANIEAGMYKPKSLWFCMITGLIIVAAGFLFRLQKLLPARIIATAITSLVMGFYFWCFVSEPEKDATYRVGLIILSSIVELIVLFLPKVPDVNSSQPVAEV